MRWQLPDDGISGGAIAADRTALADAISWERRRSPGAAIGKRNWQGIQGKLIALTSAESASNDHEATARPKAKRQLHQQLLARGCLIEDLLPALGDETVVSQALKLLKPSGPTGFQALFPAASASGPRWRRKSRGRSSRPCSSCCI
jgi:hypothetical protein